ncbi:MAG: hypothetical protein H7Y10_00095 [Flavobacterium sp.]|nr:hypothetical protein [Flavobacterium sp.]
MKTKLLLLTLASFLLFSFISIKTSDDDKLKTKLTGTWSGSEEDNQIRGVTKYWIQIRNKNGTYILMYTTIENCEVENFVEKGKWWIKDGLFYEAYEGKGNADVYAVEVLDANNLKFKAKELSSEFDNKEYEFTEIRQE